MAPDRNCSRTFFGHENTHSQRITQLHIIGATTLAILLVVLYSGQCPAQVKYPYKPRGDRIDRIEGILDSIERGNEKIDLVGFTRILAGTAQAKNTEKFQIVFDEPESSRVYITVRELDKNYQMVPLEKHVHDGRFSWPTKIASNYNIGVEDLLPLAEVYAPRFDKYYAAITLSHGGDLRAPAGYQFCFEAHSQVDSFQYSIYSLDEGTLVYASSELAGPAPDQPLCFQWSGRTNEGASVKAGVFKLEVIAFFGKNEPLMRLEDRKVHFPYYVYLDSVD